MPPPVQVDLAGYTIGTDVDIPLVLTGVNQADALATGKLMVKASASDADGAALVSIAINTTPQASGQITQTGAAGQGAGTGAATFSLTKAQTALFADANGYPLQLFWDCCFFTAAGKKYTPVRGRVRFDRAIVQAQS